MGSPLFYVLVGLVLGYLLTVSIDCLLAITRNRRNDRVLQTAQEHPHLKVHELKKSA